MAIAAQNAFPSLGEIATLVRVLVNESKKGATGTPGEGQVLTNTSVALQTLMNSAIRETARECRIMGQPCLIRDNYLLNAIPPLNSTLGFGVANPAVQVAISYAGYFDGTAMNPLFPLPGDMLEPLEMWERMATTTSLSTPGAGYGEGGFGEGGFGGGGAGITVGTASNFPYGLMKQSAGALSPRMQVQRFGEWEWRENQIWLHGATQYNDLRLRYLSKFVSLAGTGINWNYTFVPIPDSEEAIADKVAARYAARLGGDQVSYAMERAAQSILRLKQQLARQRQMIDYQRPPYGQNFAGSAGSPANWLY